MGVGNSETKLVTFGHTSKENLFKGDCPKIKHFFSDAYFLKY